MTPTFFKFSVLLRLGWKEGSGPSCPPRLTEPQLSNVFFLLRMDLATSDDRSVSSPPEYSVDLVPDPLPRSVTARKGHSSVHLCPCSRPSSQSLCAKKRHWWLSCCITAVHYPCRQQTNLHIFWTIVPAWILLSSMTGTCHFSSAVRANKTFVSSLSVLNSCVLWFTFLTLLRQGRDSTS